MKEETFHQLIGLEIQKTETGPIIKLPLKPSHLNSGGSVHGGVHATLLDVAMGQTILFYGQYKRLLTLEMQVHYVKAVNSGLLWAKGEIIHKNRSSILTESRVFTEDNELVAHGTGTFYYK